MHAETAVDSECKAGSGWEVQAVWMGWGTTGPDRDRGVWQMKECISGRRDAGQLAAGMCGQGGEGPEMRWPPVLLT